MTPELQAALDRAKDAADGHGAFVYTALADLIAAVEAVCTWQPMETAPKDGLSDVLLWGKSGVVAVATWRKGLHRIAGRTVNGYWGLVAPGYSAEDDEFPDTPTGWMPAPESQS
jgi:hypothetical protein